jgi:hypothetical protein
VFGRRRRAPAIFQSIRTGTERDDIRDVALNTVTEWVAWMYVFTNTFRIVFYGPQIRAVLKARDGAAAVSITTWSFWTFANLTAALYGWMVINDRAFTAIFIGNLACTATVTLVASVKRYKARAAR